MTLRDFGLLVLVCLIWGLNNIVSKYVLTNLHVPPLFFAAVRFALVALLMAPWLRNPPRPWWRLIAVALLMGAANFSLVFVGLQTATPSAAAVVMQLAVPMTTLLSWVLLGERMTPRRGVGVFLTFAGAMTVMWDPHGVKLSSGLLYIVVATALGSLGAVLMKQMKGVKPLQYQAWVGFVSVWPLVLLTAMLEPGQVQAGLDAGWPYLLSVVFIVLVVSIISHPLFFWLVQRYEANLISPLTLMTPLATIGLGVAIFNDPFGPRMIIGTVVALTGVLVVALRPGQVQSLLISLRSPRG